MYNTQNHTGLSSEEHKVSFSGKLYNKVFLKNMLTRKNYTGTNH